MPPPPPRARTVAHVDHYGAYDGISLASVRASTSRLPPKRNLAARETHPQASSGSPSSISLRRPTTKSPEFGSIRDRPSISLTHALSLEPSVSSLSATRLSRSRNDSSSYSQSRSGNELSISRSTAASVSSESSCIPSSTVADLDSISKYQETRDRLASNSFMSCSSLGTVSGMSTTDTQRESLSDKQNTANELVIRSSIKEQVANEADEVDDADRDSYSDDDIVKDVNNDTDDERATGIPPSDVIDTNSHKLDNSEAVGDALSDARVSDPAPNCCVQLSQADSSSVGLVCASVQRSTFVPEIDPNDANIPLPSPFIDNGPWPSPFTELDTENERRRRRSQSWSHSSDELPQKHCVEKMSVTSSVEKPKRKSVKNVRSYFENLLQREEEKRFRSAQQR